MIPRGRFQALPFCDSVRNRGFLQTQPCSHPSGESSWGSRGTDDPQGHRDYWSKATCQKHPLMDSTGPFGLAGRVAPALGEEACRLACRCATGWWAPATDGQGSNCTFCSPFPPKTQTVYILGYPTPKIREEITVAVGV